MLDTADSRLSRHLPKAMNSSEDMDDYRRLDAVLQNVARGDPGSIWMSKTLPLDLCLPLECFPPVSMIVQALFLAPGHPVFLVTVFDPEKVLEDETFDREEDSQQVVAEETEEISTYTVQMGKLLTTALFNYCCCDFILLPCIIKSGDLNRTSLGDEVRKQVAASRMYYGGPEKLSENSYRQLKEAATFVTGVSHVPRFLGALDMNQGHMVLMDPDWRGVVSLLIEDLTNSQKQHVTYPKKGKVKMHVAVMEAAKRLSFTETVVIITPNKQLQECCGLLKDQVLEDTGMELKLSVVNPGDKDQPDGIHIADYIVLLDCSNDVEVQTEDAVVLRVSEGSNDWSRV